MGKEDLEGTEASPAPSCPHAGQSAGTGTPLPCIFPRRDSQKVLESLLPPGRFGWQGRRDGSRGLAGMDRDAL